MKPRDRSMGWIRLHARSIRRQLDVVESRARYIEAHEDDEYLDIYDGLKLVEAEVTAALDSAEHLRSIQ
jgi:hypothetical protein